MAFEKILAIAGKNNFELDKRISVGYILRLCRKYGMMMLRGKLFSIGHSSISKSVFIGKKVTVLEKKSVTIGKKTKIHDGVYIDAISTDGVHIGDYAVIGRNTRLECTGSLSSVGVGISIGDRTTFGSDCYFGAAGGITIGSDVVGGQYIRFHAENHNFDDLGLLIREQGVSRNGIIIGNNCWIGAGAVFLDGARLGDGCVVAANAVVTKEFPNDSVIGGIPAKILRKRGDNDE